MLAQALTFARGHDNRLDVTGTSLTTTNALTPGSGGNDPVLVDELSLVVACQQTNYSGWTWPAEYTDVVLQVNDGALWMEVRRRRATSADPATITMGGTFTNNTNARLFNVRLTCADHSAPVLGTDTSVGAGATSLQVGTVGPTTRKNCLALAWWYHAGTTSAWARTNGWVTQNGTNNSRFSRAKLYMPDTAQSPETTESWTTARNTIAGMVVIQGIDR